MKALRYLSGIPQIALREVGAPVPAELVYISDKSGELRLAWKLTIQAPDGAQVWDVLIDAFDESVRRVHDQIRHASYRVYPLPLESPDEGPSALIVDPADPTFSPYGWHDGNGQPGAEYLNTRGNNAGVVEDRNGNNGVGSSPNGGADLVFDFPPDPADTSDFRPAAVNAFYWVNLMHDIHSRFGFDEASGNFQRIHYAGRSSGAGDPVLVDIQDSGDQNNASMWTPADGSSPRMSFYLYTHSTVEVLPPSPIAGSILASVADFGVSLSQGAVTGRVVEALDAINDDGPSSRDACTTILNPQELAGNIALLRRGSCKFIQKVKGAQDAGATAVIVYNDDRGDLLSTMHGDDPSIVIPSVFVPQSAGEEIRTALADGVDAILSIRPPLDSAFDNGVVIHEFGHGVSTRLTGGASVNDCLTQAQSMGMGEGWSDWWGMVFTVKPEDAPYRLEATDTLGSTEWDMIDDAVESQGVITSFTLPDLPGSTRFYRIMLAPSQPNGTGR